MTNVNVLSARYVTKPMNAIFSETGKIVRERELWIAVMKAQKELGVNIPSEAIERYEAAKNDVNLDRIRAREEGTRHDVKARIEEFVALAGGQEYVHLGMTSKDLTDNVDQMQLRTASKLVFGKFVSVLKHLMGKAEEFRPLEIVARTHNQPAQPTLMGRRFVMWGEELYENLVPFESFVGSYPLRGIKGAVGTQFDMATLLGDKSKVAELERRVMEHLGFERVLSAPGQVYPRSLDLEMVNRLVGASAACGNLAIGMRLMAGYELVTEGFKEGQVGSTAMPYKMNTPHSERVWSAFQLLKAYQDATSRIAGETWLEGDVSDSMVRRVVLPDAFYTADGLCETALTVLNEMGAYKPVIDREVDRYLPFMASTEILTAAVKAGLGREAAHGLIKKHAIAEALRMRNGENPNLAAKLAGESDFATHGLTEESMREVLADKAHFVGSANEQIDEVAEKAAYFLAKYPDAAAYEPEEIL
ncbi:MAG: adenylosuccinate lyase [Nanoarchaeota archaeon]